MGIKPDAKSREVFFDLNSEFKATQSIKKGANVIMVVPDDMTHGGFKESLLEIPSDSNPVFVLGQARVRESSRLRTAALTLPVGTYDTEGDRQAYVNAVSTVARSAESIQNERSKIKPEDYRIGMEMIEDANRASKASLAGTNTGRKLNRDEVALIERLGASAAAIATTGKAPNYNVTVHVVNAKGVPVAGLTVYSLPGPVIDGPERYTDQEILSRLTHYSFMNETSPSRGSVSRTDARIWVGPPRNYEAMVEVVKQKKLSGKYIPLDDQQLGVNTAVKVLWPDQVVK